jgi:hypothetical protein
MAATTCKIVSHTNNDFMFAASKIESQKYQTKAGEFG